MNNAMRRIRGCAELATVPRIKAQLTKTRVKYHFVQQRVQWDRKPKRTNRFPLFRKSAPLLRRMKRKITRTIKRQSCATAVPLPVSVYPGDLRSSLPWGITLDHLWDAEQEKTSRWGRRGLHGERRRPQNTVNNADNQLVHQLDQHAFRSPACCPRLVPTRCSCPSYLTYRVRI